MPRKPLLITDSHPYHVTNRSNNKEWFYIPIEESWEVFTDVLSRCCEMYQAEIHTFVLMSNHYHLILSTPKRNLSKIIRYFQTEVCREIQRRSGRINHVFGGRYKWSALTSASAIAYGYKYVLRNPVVAGVCGKVEDYPFSTLWNKNKYSFGHIPLVEGITLHWKLLPKSESERLNWLNRPTPKECEQILSKALRRFEFGFSKGNDVRQELNRLSYYYDIPLPPIDAPATFSAE